MMVGHVGYNFCCGHVGHTFCYPCFLGSKQSLPRGSQYSLHFCSTCEPLLLRPYTHIHTLQERARPYTHIHNLQDRARPYTHIHTLQERARPYTHIHTWDVRRGRGPTHTLTGSYMAIIFWSSTCHSVCCTHSHVARIQLDITPQLSCLGVQLSSHVLVPPLNTHSIYTLHTEY